jgi:sec-independent protein translocase protein TatB
MFEVGFWEMVLVGIVGLLVFGPEKLPRVARELALWVRKARSMVSSVKQEIDHELQVQELQESLDRQRKMLGSLTLESAAKRLAEPSGDALPTVETGESVPVPDANGVAREN